MPRILICTNSYPPQIGGLATYSSQLAIHLGKLNFEVTVLAPKSPGFKAFDEDRGCQTMRYSSKLDLYQKVQKSFFQSESSL